MAVWRNLSLLLSSLLSLSCSVSPPAGVKPVDHFTVDRYLGTWYEIARLDHTFERGLSHVTARYALQPDGSLQVINTGYSAAKQRWRHSIGKARFLGSPQTASLKVSFFGPFYGGYHVIALDEDYRYALVADRATITSGYCRVPQRWTSRPGKRWCGPQGRLISRWMT